MQPLKPIYKGFTLLSPLNQWAWLALAALGLVLLLFIGDLKSPVVNERQTCLVTATGLEVTRWQKGLSNPPRILYQTGQQPVHRLGFWCPVWGAVMVNDPDAFQYSVLISGQQAHIHHRVFRWLPEQWQLQVAAIPILNKE